MPADSVPDDSPGRSRGGSTPSPAASAAEVSEANLDGSSATASDVTEPVSSAPESPAATPATPAPVETVAVRLVEVAPAAAAPVMTAVSDRRDGLSAIGAGLLSWLGSRGSVDAAPLMWTAAAFSRRELNGSTAKPAAAVTATSGLPLLNLPSAAASGGLAPTPFRLFGDGTAAADRPGCSGWAVPAAPA